jgi:Helix-loop-helix DNA-binding domain
MDYRVDFYPHASHFASGRATFISTRSKTLGCCLINKRAPKPCLSAQTHTGVVPDWFSMKLLCLSLDGLRNAKNFFLLSTVVCFLVVEFLVRFIFQRACELMKVIEGVHQAFFTHVSVERRRRFNINDRIKELGTLLPKNNDP